jgi:hypothetical protein
VRGRRASGGCGVCAAGRRRIGASRRAPRRGRDEAPGGRPPSRARRGGSARAARAGGRARRLGPGAR